MEDHGQIITHFEDIFGSYIDHEVIKIILQACDWDPNLAQEKLSNIIDNDEAIDSKPKNKSFATALSQTPKVNNPPIHQNNNVSVEASETKAINTTIKKIENLISSHEKVLIIMRGLPGSGKSTLAHSLNTKTGVVLSTDDYFYDKFNNYNFNPAILSEAHNWNKDRTKFKIYNGVSPIFIDNTNLQTWEFEPYLRLGLNNSYHVELLEPQTTWRYDSKELANRCTHKVPKKKIEEMKERFEINMSIDNIPAFKKTLKKNTNQFSKSHLKSEMNQIDYFGEEEKDLGSSISHNNEECSPQQFARKDTLNAQIDSEVVSNNLFSQLVDDFGNLLREEIDKKDKAPDRVGLITDCSSDNDEAMYKFCSDLEDKLGKPILSLNNSEDSKKIHLSSSKCLNLSTIKPQKDILNPTEDHSINNQVENWTASCDLGSWNEKNKIDQLENKQENKSKSPRIRKKKEFLLQDRSDYDYKEEEEDPSLSSWVPVDSNQVSWEEGNSALEPTTHNGPSQQWSQTGAIPKKLTQCNTDPKPKAKETGGVDELIIFSDKFTQYSTFDYSELSNDSKVLCGNASFVSHQLPDVKNNEPLTKNKLFLHKGTMTEETNDTNVEKDILLKRLISFFPDIKKADFEDVLEKCNYDLDWAMNILIDSGYKLSESCDQKSSNSECDSTDSDSDVKVNSQSTNDLSSFGYQSDISDMPSEECKELKKQALLASSTQAKLNVEKSLQASKNVDDRIRRLTKKEYEELKISKIKGKKTKPCKNQRSVVPETESSSEEEGSEGSQYLTVEIDPLFASQLINIYGPISSLNLTSGFTKEVRRVVLPLEICHQIYQFWAETLEGKFQHEKDVLDKFIREDEELARRLQEEENSKVNISPDAIDEDPPTSFQEILNIEKALELSNVKNTANDTLSSELLSLQKLQEEFNHIDPSAVEGEYYNQSYNYNATKSLLLYKYGSKSTPKTVVAPGITMGVSLKEEEQSSVKTSQDKSWEEDEIAVDDPQVYRDEAQMHYLERKKAFQKAQDASQKGMKSVASFYAQIGNTHMQKFKEANERAAKKILIAVNSNKGPNTIDLHLLHVDEALREVQSFLIERKSMLFTKNLNEFQVTIITGKGNHSVGGEARLKPAIRYFLKNEGYAAQEYAGMFKVTLKP